MRITFLAGAAVVALAVSQAGAAHAQETDAADQSPAAAQHDDNVITVTAQRREESTTDVPISLTVRSGEDLEEFGIETIRDLHIGTPGLRIDRNGISLQPSIRGITALDGNVGNDANVSLYVDGVYRPNPAANNIDFPDVEQVEVLKGPQGTLFGRNATGGAIRITTMRPSFDTSGSVTAGYGSFERFVAKGFLTGPVAGDAVAAGLSAYYEESEGYLNDLTRGGEPTGGLKSWLVRGKILAIPSDRIEILFSGHYAHRSDGSLFGQPFRGNTAARGTSGAIIPTEPYDVASDIDPRVDVDEYTFSANATIDLGFADLTSISSYSNVDIYSPVEADYTNIARQYFITNTTQKTFSQELTLSSNADGRFSWLAGAFYYDDDAQYDPLRVVTGGAPFDIFGRQTTEAVSVFGEATFEIVPRLTLIGGLRYSYEERTLSGSFGTEAYPELASETFDSITPRVSARYELPSGTNFYATYSEGFKSGGFSASSLSTTPFQPEKVKAWEVGVKTTERSIARASMAAFYYDYRDQQVQSATTLGNGTTVGTTTNAASSEIYGAEFEGSVDVSDEFTILATVSWLHARYDSFPTAFAQVPIMVGGALCLCGNVGANINATGNQLVRAPDFAGSVTLDYQRDFAGGLLKANVTAYASDKFFFTPDNRVGQPAYETVSARLSYETLDRNWELTVWGKNLTDAVVYQGASILPEADGILFAPPRSFGVEVRRSF